MLTKPLVLVLVTLDAWRDGLRRHWRRLLVGAFVGWALASIVGAAGVVVLELRFGVVVDEAPTVAFVWSGVLAGAAVAYSIRRERR